MARPRARGAYRARRSPPEATEYQGAKADRRGSEIGERRLDDGPSGGPGDRMDSGSPATRAGPGEWCASAWECRAPGLDARSTWNDRDPCVHSPPSPTPPGERATLGSRLMSAELQGPRNGRDRKVPPSSQEPAVGPSEATDSGES